MFAEQYWKEFYRLKTHCIYIEKYRERTDNIDRWLKGALAVTSSVSIGAWAIWRDAAFVWAGIIAASQVLSAISPFLPYRERLRNLTTFGIACDELLLGVESKWLSIAAGELTDVEIREALAELRKQRSKNSSKHLVAVLPANDGLLVAAEAEATTYINNMYPTPT